jgi:NAD+ kinase
MRRLGLVVHPTRSLDWVLDILREWADEHDVEVGQLRIGGQQREVADPVEADDVDLVLALGGDGTTLAALHAGAEASRPVLGIACGSVGVLTSVTADRMAWALDEVMAERYTRGGVPGLEVEWETGERQVALNDLVVLRAGAGQVMVEVNIDGELFARLAGDGLVVATPLGSSAYTTAAGGPLLAAGAGGIAVTPLAMHGGSCPPLVTGPEAVIELAVQPGYGGMRYEIDGRRCEIAGLDVTARLRPAYATIVTLSEEEPRLTGLRRRKLILDSPRVYVHHARWVPATEDSP